MKTLARISLLLVFVLVVISAYLRLHESGIGCADWPACYGLIGRAPAVASVSVAENAYPRIVALIGIRSGSLHHRAVVMGSLTGGFILLGLLGWLVFRLGPGAARYTETRIRKIRPLVMVALFMLGFQIILGGLTSANFAATACQTLPDCNGSWFPDATIYSAFKLNETREVTSSGMAVGGLERIAIHLAHRVGAVLATLAIIAAAIAAIMGTAATRKVAYFALLLVVAESAIGVASVLTHLPIGLAVAHNWLAGLLVLSMLKLLALSRESWRGG